MGDLEDGVLHTALGELNISMATETGEGNERFIMAHGVKLEEKLWVDECYLFQDESIAPIFCKPKLIPLKTITTQKLEQMQKEQMEKLQVPEGKEDDTVSVESEGAERDDAQPSTSETKEADVWTADD
ncbi:hypothetical protein GCK72_018791 [Caenorhabditis remanei]|uniref:Uncharacterized protein n=1 Tax=Caenorhabditis remanei TaxID=31234 RepID=E3LZM5_CAERE|nr:hypothetical protein GCK72_018791 [Caenorhabditis remanei]EFO87556.1 hypothetical protein CRE_05705 [Caenorhabditis remanei]KAF1752237.1 hypothetical protein GCK72_018791 [Caenorhabditis remanei]